MNKKQNPYCQLIHYDFCKLKVNFPFKNKQLLLGDSNHSLCYVEEYKDFDSVEYRILELSREWEQGEIHQKFKHYNLMIELNNQWGDSISIGTYNGNTEWYVSGISNYSLESIEKRKKAENDVNLKTQLIEFYMSTETTYFWSDLIARQAAIKIVKEWLDTGGYTQYFLNNLGEIQTRKYPFDEETIKEIEENWKNIDNLWTPISF